MPIGKIISAGIKAKKAYDQQQKQQAQTPTPGMPARSGPTLAQPSKKANANRAADMFLIPGRDVVRGGMAKRKKTLDEL